MLIHSMPLRQSAGLTVDTGTGGVAAVHMPFMSSDTLHGRGSAGASPSAAEYELAALMRSPRGEALLQRISPRDGGAGLWMRDSPPRLPPHSADRWNRPPSNDVDMACLLESSGVKLEDFLVDLEEELRQPALRDSPLRSASPMHATLALSPPTAAGTQAHGSPAAPQLTAAAAAAAAAAFAAATQQYDIGTSDVGARGQRKRKPQSDPRLRKSAHQ